MCWNHFPPRDDKNNRAFFSTLSDVAKKAGVSTAPISRCLNTPEYAKESTSRKVKKAVDALAYKPNFGVRTRATKQTKTIGAFIPTMKRDFCARSADLSGWIANSSLYFFRCKLILRVPYRIGTDTSPCCERCRELALNRSWPKHMELGIS